MGKEKETLVSTWESGRREIIFSDGSRGVHGDFPVAIAYIQRSTAGDTRYDNLVVDPVFSDAIYNNLYGRIMTLVEATTDPQRLKAVKDVFSKELHSWQSDVYHSAREITDGGDSSDNLYTRRTGRFVAPE